MKALVKAQPAPGLWMQDVVRPQAGPDGVLIRIRRMAICGTDLHIYNWDSWAQANVPVPTIIGHEYSGEIVAVGANVKRVQVGQRVSGEGHIVGERSRNVRAGRFHLDPETKGIGVNLPGAFAEYLVIPAFNAVPLPDYVDDEIGALLDPLGNAVHTALAYDLVGEDVLITGAGPIGIMAAAVARFAGARHIVITDVNDYRLDLARRVTGVRAVNIGREPLTAVMQELEIVEGFDVGLEMSGAPGALAQIVEVMIMGGKIALLGIPAGKTEVDWSRIILKALQIKGIYGREMFETWYKMLALIRAGLDLKFLITHRFPISDYEQAFSIARAGQSGKIVLNWP